MIGMCPRYMSHQRSTSESKETFREAMMTGAQFLVLLADFTAWLNGNTSSYSSGTCLATYLYLYNGTIPSPEPSTN